MKDQNDRVDKVMCNDLSEWSADGVQKLDCCPLCKSALRNLLYDDLKDDLFHSAPGKWKMFQCSSCGLGYLDPRPSPATIGIAYRNYFTHNEDLPYQFENAGGKFVARLKKGILSRYLNTRFGVGKSSPLAFLGYLVYLRPRFRAMIDASMRHLPKPHPGDRLLDVGCGSGRFMVSARAAGWACTGTEVDPRAAQAASGRGFEIHCGPLADFHSVGRRFHAITISHVLEHVHDPVALLRDAFQLLELDGRLWIETPNLGAFGHAYFGRAWRDLDAPRHLQIFNHAGLMKLLREIGFREIKIAPWQLDWEIVAPASVRLAQLQQSGKTLKIVDPSKGERVGRCFPEKREFVTMVAKR